MSKGVAKAVRTLVKELDWRSAPSSSARHVSHTAKTYNGTCKVLLKLFNSGVRM
jgi:hypothetical protein